MWGCGRGGGAPEVAPPPARGQVAFLVHGYISDAEDFDPLGDALAHGGMHGEPVHTHRFDFGRFSRVGYDHNLGVARLGDALGEAVSVARRDCPVCRAEADKPLSVTLIGRSFGGLVVREAWLQQVDQEWGPWSIDRIITLATPYHGSKMTRYSTGFLSVLINGGIRTVLYGFVNPERGGAFGQVYDDQIRAMRLGSPYQLDADDRIHARLSEQEAPPWLVLPSVGARDYVREGDGVVRFSSGNVAPTMPRLGVETVPLSVRHGRLFSGTPKGQEEEELARALVAIRYFMDHGTMRGAPGFSPYLFDGSAFVPGEAPGTTVFLPTEREQHKRLVDRLEGLARADLGDVWLRFFSGTPGDARPVGILPGLTLLQSSEEWSRQWVDVALDQTSPSNNPVVAALPVESRHLFLSDVTPSGTWRIAVDVEGVGTIADEQLQVVVNAGAPHAGGAIEVLPLQNIVVDVYIDIDEMPVGARIAGIHWRSPDDRRRQRPTGKTNESTPSR